MVGVQNEQDVQGACQDRVGLILRLNHLPQHVHEVRGITEVVVGIDVRKAQAMAVSVGRDGGNLADQPADLQLADLRVQHVAGLWVHRGERRHGADEHAHGMRVVAEAFQKFLAGFVQHGVAGDALHPLLEFRRGGQLAVEKEVRYLQECAVLGQLLDRISAIPEDPFIAVDEGDGALARRRVEERRIVSHHAEVFGSGLDLAQIHGTDGAFIKGEFVGGAGAPVHDIDDFFIHLSSPCAARAAEDPYIGYSNAAKMARVAEAHCGAGVHACGGSPDPPAATARDGEVSVDISALANEPLTYVGPDDFFITNGTAWPPHRRRPGKQIGGHGSRYVIALPEGCALAPNTTVIVKLGFSDPSGAATTYTPL